MTTKLPIKLCKECDWTPKQYLCSECRELQQQYFYTLVQDFTQIDFDYFMDFWGAIQEKLRNKLNTYKELYDLHDLSEWDLRLDESNYFHVNVQERDRDNYLVDSWRELNDVASLLLDPTWETKARELVEAREQQRIQHENQLEQQRNLRQKQQDMKTLELLATKYNVQINNTSNLSPICSSASTLAVQALKTSIENGNTLEFPNINVTLTKDNL